MGFHHYISKIYSASKIQSNLIMGASELKCQPPKTKDFQLLNYGYCTVWKRKLDQLELMEQYDVQISTKQKLNLYKELWTIRTKSQLLVNVYYFTHQTSALLCGSFQTGSIFTQRIFYRLSQFSNINYQETISILKTCFHGYKILNSVSGLFLVRSTMIGFNEQMKVKVWHHTDFSEAQSQNPNCKNIIEMITSIISSVQNNSSYPYNYPRFSQFLADKTFYLTNFSQALIGLTQYISIYGIQAKSNISQIKNFLRRAQGWQIFAVKSQYERFNQKTFDNWVKLSKKIQNQNQTKNFYSSYQYGEDMLAKTVKKQYFSNASLQRTNSFAVGLFQFKKQQSTSSTKINKPEMYLNLRAKKQSKQKIRMTKSQQQNKIMFRQLQQSNSIRPKFIREPPKIQNLQNLNKLNAIQNEYYKSYNHQNNKQDKRANRFSGTSEIQKSLQSSISLIEDLEAKHRVKKILSNGRSLKY